MTEAELQREVMHLCRLYGLWAYHPPASPLAEPGWTDLVILGRGQALFVELKSEDGRRSLDQVKVATLLGAAGLTYRLWRPSDWNDMTIRKELESIR